MFVLYEDLAGAMAWLRHVFGGNGFEPLAGQSAGTLALSQVLQACAADHQVSAGFLQHMLIASWPLLLVMVGAILSRDALTDTVNTHLNKDGGLVDSSTGGSTLK